MRCTVPISDLTHPWTNHVVAFVTGNLIKICSALKVKKKVFLELIKQIAKATFVDANNILDCDAGDGTSISEQVTSLVVTEAFELVGAD